MAIDPETLIREIDELWASLADHSQGEEQALMRACSLTLLVLVNEEDDVIALSETLAELMQSHPSRAILIRVAAGGDERLEADVKAHCWMPMGRRQQICSEQIEIQVSERTASDLPSVLLPLIVSDLPVVLWCRSERVARLPVFRQLSAFAARLIVDVREFRGSRDALSWLSDLSRSAPGVTDLSWARVTRWRETVAQVFENDACRQRLQELAAVELTYGGNVKAGIPASAYLMAGWLMNCLGWSLDSGSWSENDGETLVLRHGNREVRMRLHHAESPGQGSRLAAVDLKSSGEPPFEILLRRVEDYLDLELSTEGGPAVSNRVWFPPSSDVALLNEELKIFASDTVFRAALDTATRISERVA